MKYNRYSTKIKQLEERLTTLEKGKDSDPSAESANPWLKDTSVNFYFDGYYAWNTNRPLGRINLLRLTMADGFPYSFWEKW